MKLNHKPQSKKFTLNRNFLLTFIFFTSFIVFTVVLLVVDNKDFQADSTSASVNYAKDIDGIRLQVKQLRNPFNIKREENSKIRWRYEVKGEIDTCYTHRVRVSETESHIVVSLVLDDLTCSNDLGKNSININRVGYITTTQNQKIIFEKSTSLILKNSVVEIPYYNLILETKYTQDESSYKLVGSIPNCILPTLQPELEHLDPYDPSRATHFTGDLTLQLDQETDKCDINKELYIEDTISTPLIRKTGSNRFTVKQISNLN